MSHPLDKCPMVGAPARFVRMFKPQFADLVLKGQKCQTVRPIPKRMPQPGDRISLRCWEGKPYRSKQRLLREAEISAVEFVEIRHDAIVIAGRELTLNGQWQFATADGFNSVTEMKYWFQATHGLPFIGIVIRWREEAECPVASTVASSPIYTTSSSP